MPNVFITFGGELRLLRGDQLALVRAQLRGITLDANAAAGVGALGAGVFGDTWLGAAVFVASEDFAVSEDVAPIVETFQSPFASFNKITCGSSISMLVTFSCLEKMSGIISTPTFKDFAVKNGDELNFGSSPIERSCAVSAP